MTGTGGTGAGGITATTSTGGTGAGGTSTGGTGGTGATSTVGSGGTGGTGATSTVGSGGSGGTGGTSTVGSGGSGGSGGGSGGSTMTGCMLGTTQPCYDGPPGSENVGQCSPGVSTCDAAGLWGPCVGQKLPAVESCGNNKDLNCDGVSGCKGGARWAKTFGGLGDDTARAIATDAAGNIVVVGSVSSAIDFGIGASPYQGGLDVFVLKLDSEGNVLWSKTFGTAQNDIASGVGIDPGGNILVGGTGGAIDFGFGPLQNKGMGDVFVVKLKPDGAVIWAQSYGGPGADQLLDLNVGPDGDPYITGSYTGIMSFLGGALPDAGALPNVFVARLKGLGGAPMWQKGFGDVGAAQYGRSVAVDSLTSDVILAVDFAGSINFGGGILTDKGNGDIAVARLLAADGAHGWSVRYGDSGMQNVTLVRQGSANTFNFAGHVTGSVDFGSGVTNGGVDYDAVAWRLLGSGQCSWTHRATGASTSFAWGVTADTSGYDVVGRM